MISNYEPLAGMLVRCYIDVVDYPIYGFVKSVEGNYTLLVESPEMDEEDGIEVMNADLEIVDAELNWTLIRSHETQKALDLAAMIRDLTWEIIPYVEISSYNHEGKFNIVGRVWISRESHPEWWMCKKVTTAYDWQSFYRNWMIFHG